MDKRTVFLALFALLAIKQAGASAHSFPRVVRDARGNSIVLRTAPRRLISLSPGTTEMLFAIGAGRRVVGDTLYCDYPDAARKVAKIGDVNPNYEEIVGLHPDLIIVDAIASPGAVTRLTLLHLPFFAVRPTTLPAVEQSMRLLGQATGSEDGAEHAVQDMERKEQAALRIAARDRTRRPKTLIVIGVSPLWVAGSGSFLDDLVRRAGGVNTGAGIQNYGPLSKEAVIANPPDIILASPQAQAVFRQDAALRTLTAVRRHRFFFLPNGVILFRPGPRLADALLQIAGALHPGVP